MRRFTSAFAGICKQVYCVRLKERTCIFPIIKHLFIQLWIGGIGTNQTSSSNVKINVHYNTLSTYLFQEIIQNADDAGASTVHFYLDNRAHGTHSLVEPQLAMFQGPSLLAYNDAIFQDKDWQSIQDMQQSVKAEDPFKVGKCGIGFNSVYHITGRH